MEASNENFYLGSWRAAGFVSKTWILHNIEE